MKNVIGYFILMGLSLSNEILSGIIAGLILCYVPIAFWSIKRKKNHEETFALGLGKVRRKCSVFDVEKYISRIEFIKNKSEWARQHNRAVENVEFNVLIDHYDSDKYIVKRKGVW